MLELTIERFTDSKVSPIDGSLTLHWAKLSSNQAESFNLCQILVHQFFANCFCIIWDMLGFSVRYHFFLASLNIFLKAMKNIPRVLIQKKWIRIVIQCVITQKK